MAKVRFKKAPEGQPIPNAGEWCVITNVHRVPPTREPCIGCPICGCHAALDHDVADDGTVTPSLVCPQDDCSFHDWGILEDWDKSDS